MAALPFIGVIDYGRGNLRSVAKALERVGARVKVGRKAGALAGASGLLLPGVGAFGDAMGALRHRGFVSLLRRQVAEDRPLLGVCLGLQLFCRDSDEFGLHKGLGFFDLQVRRFGKGLKVPHMGWNTVKHDPACPLFKGVAQGAPFYFLHSYRAGKDGEGVAAEAEYGKGGFAAALWRGNVFATQFHPEKSQDDGLALYRNFWGLCRGRALRGGKRV
ncbi:MAG TPA: imidazole glycerol phosphate synthase subunit HisH [bacterium]|jgi:glutamine amidotransferase|nr:imidazole glycerol phosphate synthase subunit HisH [bacterium]